MQKTSVISPKYLNLDSSYESLKPDESPYIRDLTWDENANPFGTPVGQGQNAFALSPIVSNQAIAFAGQSGYNRTILNFYSETTQETYFGVYNGNGNHAIYVVYGDTKTIAQVIVDPQLGFTDNQNGFIQQHRASMRTFLNNAGQVVEKILLLTDGNSWQKWILVNSAIQTGGFNASLFSYWTLQPPHFDRRELLEWAVRPPMYCPTVATIPNTPADTDQVNRVIDTAFQYAYGFQNTDGRTTVFSPFSLPVIIKSEDYLNNPDSLPKNILITMYAGSPLTESINIYVRKNALNANSIPSITEWSDWYLYDTIYKYNNTETSESSVIGTQYWLRTNPWANYAYDPNLNQIQYTFDNSNVLQIIDQTDAARLQNDIPQLSVALSDLGDAEGLANNRRDYDNLSASVLNNLGVQVVEQEQVGCQVATRTIQLYAYIGMATDSEWYISQVGFYDGANTQMRFGGLNYGPGGSDTAAGIDFTISTNFDLNFADQNAFRCYLKGTPYYDDGLWYQVNSDFSLVQLPALLDFSNPDILTFVRNVFISGGFFVCVFNLTVPAGRYIATIGRHNVPSTGDFRDTSTYIYGIANSRTTSAVNAQTNTIKPNAIVSYSKEIEVDCTNANVDVWGNGQDLFYIYCPYTSEYNFRFIEGYLQEDPDSPLGVELYSYNVETGSSVGGSDWGKYTDKNGFYWAYIVSSNAGISDVHITGNINCVQVDFDIKTAQGGFGWKQNPIAYLSDHNDGVVGACNRVLLNGTITALDGVTGYSNIAVSIKDGATVLTNQNGMFTLVIHNGGPALRVSNVYVNSGGNFVITLAGCATIPITQYNEALVPCINCNTRTYPIPLNLAIFIQNTSQMSLKQGGKYAVGCLVADLAGRVSFVNIIGKFAVPSFIERQDTLATYFQLLFNGPLNLNAINPDWKWFAPSVSPNLTDPVYIEWVGDYIEYIDNNGNVVTDVSSAVYCSISIQSLYNYNITRNFSTLANYQFTLGDRLRIYDDGEGNLLTGNPIDLRILGQNYNQAAQTAGLIPSTSTVPIINNNINSSSSSSTSITDGSGTTTTATTIQTQQNNENITLYVLYDPRLTPLINDTGFWIEIYTPAEQSSILTFSESQGFLPIISGEVCDFVGFSNGQPVYNFLASLNLSFWDTYLFQRNITIPNIGDKFFSHPFESTNISDTFGYDITSGGRENVNNNNAKQMWYNDEVIKSDDFVSEGLLNGIGTFRSTNPTNRKVFKDFRSGGIVGMKALRNLVAFICENDYFITDYSFQYIYANAQGVQLANLDNNLGSPHQKIGDAFGCAYEDTGTILFFDKFVFWYDYKNEAFVQMGWGPAADITRFDEGKGTQGYVSSYFNKKTQFIKGWNSQQTGNSQLFDVVVGADYERNNIYITFRGRRNNSNDPRSYFNGQRNKNLQQQETIVYNLPSRRFVRFAAFTPESYGILKGYQSGLEMLSFAAGVPYIHNNTGNQSFCNFYGLQAIPCFVGPLNENAGIVKVLQNISVDSVYNGYYVDEIFSEEKGSFSYIPIPYIRKKENEYYAPVLRNMSSYPQPNSTTDPLYRSSLTDSAGKRVFGRYFIARFVAQGPNQYSELQAVYYEYTASEEIKK
jgi:hypothetical protein